MSTCHQVSRATQWFFIEQPLLHHIVYLGGRSPHIPARRCCFFSPLLLPFATPELSQSWRVLKIHPVHTPRETLVSLWLLVRSISPAYRELLDMAHIISCTPLTPGVSWKYSIIHKDQFMLCLSRPFPCTFGSRVDFTVWLLERAHQKSTGLSAGDAHGLELQCMTFLWVPRQCIPTWVLSIWSLLGH